jgi:cyclohexyl-isocyanide hydratase
MLIFPRLTQLDMTGPYEVLARLPNTKVHLVAHTMAPVETDRGMQIVPTVTFADCPQLDLVMVPGGPGQQDLMEDAVVLEFLRRQAMGAKYVTSVCTGSLVLGAAGLLKGKRATSHWAALEHLRPLGAIPVSEKVVMDGNIITGAGVTSGIDFALGVAAVLEGEDVPSRSSCRSSTIRHHRSIPARRTPHPPSFWRWSGAGLLRSTSSGEQ